VKLSSDQIFIQKVDIKNTESNHIYESNNNKEKCLEEMTALVYLEHN
jgi:hypothetical protein